MNNILFIIQPGTTDKRVHTSIDSTTAESTAVPSQIPKDRDADIPKQRAKIVMSNTFDGVFLYVRQTLRLSKKMKKGIFG